MEPREQENHLRRDGGIVISISRLMVVVVLSLIVADKTVAGVGVGKNHRWPGTCIPFELRANLPPLIRVAYRLALDHWNDHAAMRFCERQGQQAFVLLTEVPYRGGMSRGEAQTGYDGEKSRIILRSGAPDTGDDYVYFAIHELAHSAGLKHEHQRCDREKHVEIIAPGDPEDHKPECCGFFEFCEQEVVGAYDLDSVTQYRNPTVIKAIGSSKITTGACLSFGDLDTIAKLYGKPSTVTKITCPDRSVKTR